MLQRENYNDLYAFLCVAREQNFTKAATKLGISQSALSRTIKQLESRLGVQLFARTTRRLSLTLVTSFFKPLNKHFLNSITN